MTPALRDEIKTAVLLEQGVKLSDQDPLFAYLIGNQRVLDNFHAPIVAAINALPEALGESVQIIAAAVEASEKAASDLANQTQGALKGIAKVELESAHRAAQATIQGTVATLLTGALQGAGKEVTDLERRVKAMGGGWGGARSVLVTTCLSVALAATIVIASAGGLVLYHWGQQHSEAAAYWHGQAKQAGRG